MTATLSDTASGSRAIPGARATTAFHHEALFYSGDEGFLAGTVPFLSEAVDVGHPALVVVSAARIALLQSALKGSDGLVFFADMASVGRNPARIIPAWREFLNVHAKDGQPVRGIGEPISAARSSEELVECQRHEALLNVAFADSLAWSLLCPYDVDALAPGVIEEAGRSHPFIRHSGAGGVPSGDFRVDEMSAAHGAAPLTEPTRCLESLNFNVSQLALVRSVAETRASQFGLTDSRLDDLVLAVHEIAANSVRHGGGAGRFRLWRDRKSLVAEISDQGVIKDPLAGREHPGAHAERGRGLWIANQVCDLVQIRTSEAGTVVRLHVSLASA